MKTLTLNSNSTLASCCMASCCILSVDYEINNVIQVEKDFLLIFNIVCNIFLNFFLTFVQRQVLMEN